MYTCKLLPTTRNTVKYRGVNKTEVLCGLPEWFTKRLKISNIYAEDPLVY